MKSDPVWRETKGNYYHLPKSKHPNQGMMFGWSILMHNGLDFDFRIDQGWEEVRKEVFSWDGRGDDGGLLLREKARSYDVNDLLIRNSALGSFDIDEHLPALNTPALILHVKNDLWLRARLAEQSSKRIPGARFASFPSPLAHYGVFQVPHVLGDEVLDFFRKIGLE
ncbi:MAG: hypothetical protein P8182_09720 [Deltaproteobacteria bacterium]